MHCHLHPLSTTASDTMARCIDAVDGDLENLICCSILYHHCNEPQWRTLLSWTRCHLHHCAGDIAACMGSRPNPLHNFRHPHLGSTNDLEQLIVTWVCQVTRHCSKPWWRMLWYDSQWGGSPQMPQFHHVPAQGIKSAVIIYMVMRYFEFRICKLL